MNFFKNAPLRRKQRLIIVLVTSVALVFAFASIATYDINSFSKNLSNQTGALAVVTGGNAVAALDFNDASSAEQTLSALNAIPGVVAACIYTPDGKVFASYQSESLKAQYDFPKMQGSGDVFKRDQLWVFRPIIAKGEPSGTIFIAADLSALTDHLNHYLLITGGVIFLALLASFTLSSRLQRTIINPILDLERMAKTVAQKQDYSIRARKFNSDEIGSLADGFNEMLAQIQERDANLEKRVTERTGELEKQIGERRKAEEALQQSQAMYHSLVEQLPAGVFRKDASGRFVFVNSWFCKIKGAKAEYFVGHLPGECGDGETPKRSFEDAEREERLTTLGLSHHDQIMKTGKPIELEEDYPDATGAKQYFHVVKSAVFDPHGNVIGSQGILFDITQRKRIEARLAREHELLRALLDNSEDKIYFKDSNSKFIRCSSSMAQIFKVHSPDELTGKCDGDYFSTEHAEQAYKDEQDIIRSGQAIIGKVEKETWPDGKVTWALTNKMPLRNETGKIIGTFGISKDITALKEAEAKVNEIHKQLLEASRQAGMAEVATSVLHNVGNVLNSVNVSSSLIADKVKTSKVSNLSKAVALMRAHEADLGAFLTTDAKGKQLPGYLAGLATHLTQEQEDILREVSALVNNVIHIKEIVSMQQSYAKSSGVLETIAPSELVEDALRMNNGAMDRHHITVFRDFASVPVITVEKHKVLQILVNLIRNAKYACDDGGRTEKKIIVRIDNNGKNVRIMVIDNGIGIPPENLTLIFNHGFTTRKQGHGFGLHSGALAARELGGSLTAFSEGVGKGAMFTLELPLQKPKNILESLQ